MVYSIDGSVYLFLAHPVEQACKWTVCFEVYCTTLSVYEVYSITQYECWMVIAKDMEGSGLGTILAFNWTEDNHNNPKSR